MPPRSRRTISYNLSNASARAAFEHGLDYHDDISDEEACGSAGAVLLGTSPNSGNSAAQQWRSRPQPSAFPTANSIHRVPDGGALLSGQGTERQTVDIINLLELFPAADRSLLEEVYTGCSCSFDAALDVLSEMLSAKAPHHPSPHHPPDASHSDSTQDTQGTGTASWNDLPEEVKDIILGMLPTMDVSRAAVTCKDFSRRVRLGAISAQVLTIPVGLSLSGVIGMVAGHPNAHTVSLARWGRKGLQDRDLAALLTAISNGSRSSRRNTPVESISFRGWSGLKDGHIMTLCNTLQHLRELDLTECSGITDASLLELSKYQRSPPPARPPAAAADLTSNSSSGALGCAAPDDREEGQEEEEGGEPAAACAPQDDDLQFEFEAAAAEPAAAAAAAADGGARRVASRPGPAAGACWDEGCDDDEEMRSVRLEGLAALASSPPISWLSASGSPAGSPPSSLMAPERALGAALRPPPGRREGDSAGGWVGSWDRRGGVAALPAPGAANGCAGVPRLASAAGAGLRSLVLAGCSLISAEGVRALLSASVVKASLESLDVSRCTRMTRQALQVPPASCLRVLKCAGCGNLQEVIIQLPPTCPLTELHLNNCKKLFKLLIVAPNLKLLHVGGCKSLTTMALRCAQLTQLLANLCFSWSEVTIEQWLCPRLSHLNLFGARHLENQSLAAILQQSPALRTLNLNGCNTLSSLSISAAHRELQSIDISGCKGMLSLSVASPGLKEVRAKACPRLQELHLDSRLLQRVDVSQCVQLRSLQLPALAQQRAQLQAVEAGAAPGAGAGPGAEPAAQPPAVLPELCTSYAERQLPGETQLLLRLLKAARRAAAAEARLAAAAAAATGRVEDATQP